VRIVPDVSVSSSNGNGLVDGLMGMLMRQEVKDKENGFTALPEESHE
jgi:hypothetical protein